MGLLYMWMRHGDIPLLGETGGDDRNAAEPPFLRENLPKIIIIIKKQCHHNPSQTFKADFVILKFNKHCPTLRWVPAHSMCRCVSIRPTGSRRHTVTGTLSPRIKYMSQHWNSEIIYAGGPGSTVEKWQAKWWPNNCSIVAEPTKTLNPRSQLRLHSYSLFKNAFGLYLNWLFGEWIVAFPPLHDLWNGDYYFWFGASALLFALKPLLPGFTLMMNDSFMAAHRSWEQ